MSNLAIRPSSAGILSNASPATLAKISAREREKKEKQIVASFKAVLSSVQDGTGDCAQRIRDIHSAETLKTMATALHVSEASARYVAEATIRLYAAFGTVINEIWPLLSISSRKNNAELALRTGISAAKCRAASRIARYSTTQLDEAFRFIASEGDLPTLAAVAAELRSPGIKAQNNRFKRAWADRQDGRKGREHDPDHAQVLEIMDEYDSLYEACQEILSLRRQIASLMPRALGQAG